MKVTCPKSGLHYTVSVGYGTASCDHPIFTLPINKLIPQLEQFAAGNLQPDDIYLLSLALLNQAPTRWYCPAVKDQAMPVILAKLEPLAKAVFRLDTLSREDIPTFVIDKSTRNLAALPDWISVLDDLYLEQSIAAKELRLNRSILRKEEAISRIMIKGLGGINPRSQNKLAGLISDWASVVGEFPKDLTQLERNPVLDSYYNNYENYTKYNTTAEGRLRLLKKVPHDSSDVVDNSTNTNTNSNTNSNYIYVPLADYWKAIINLAWTDNFIGALQARISKQDIEELITHCEDNIPHGTTHAFMLMQRLRALVDMVSEFTISNQQEPAAESKSNILGAGENITQGANSPPKKQDYENLAAYLRAKIRWQHSQIATKQQTEVVNASTAANNGGYYDL